VVSRWGASRRWAHARVAEEKITPSRDTEMGSVQGGGIETGGWRAFLDEVSQDLEDLRGVGDHGDDFQGLVTTRAAQGVRLVNLLDQAGPCGAALPGRHRQLWLRLVGRTDAGGWPGLMVVLPALGSEAQEVRATGPRATSPRGVQPVGANESAARVSGKCWRTSTRNSMAGRSFMSVWKYSL
jgi:hypothetical protein